MERSHPSCGLVLRHYCVIVNQGPNRLFILASRSLMQRQMAWNLIPDPNISFPLYSPFVVAPWSFSTRMASFKKSEYAGIITNYPFQAMKRLEIILDSNLCIASHNNSNCQLRLWRERGNRPKAQHKRNTGAKRLQVSSSKLGSSNNYQIAFFLGRTKCQGEQRKWDENEVVQAFYGLEFYRKPYSNWNTY